MRTLPGLSDDLGTVEALWRHVQRLSYADGTPYAEGLEATAVVVGVRLASPEAWAALEHAPPEGAGEAFERAADLAGIGGRRPPLRPERLAETVALVGELDLDRIPGDVIGTLYETMVGRALAAGAPGIGQFFTPRAVVDAMIERLAPGPGDVVLDPACGSGGILVRAAAAGAAVAGVEIAALPHRLAAVNLAVRGLTPLMLARGDTLADKSITAGIGPVSVIAANPPFGSGPAADGGWGPSTAKHLAFLAWIAHRLTLGGRAAVVMPESVMTAIGPAAVTARRELLRHQRPPCIGIDEVLWLPAHVFAAAPAVRTVVLFISRTERRPPRTAIPREDGPEVRSWSVSDLPTDVRTRPLTADDLAGFAGRAGPGAETVTAESDIDPAVGLADPAAAAAECRHAQAPSADDLAEMLDEALAEHAAAIAGIGELRAALEGGYCTPADDGSWTEAALGDLGTVRGSTPTVGDSGQWGGGRPFAIVSDITRLRPASRIVGGARTVTPRASAPTAAEGAVLVCTRGTVGPVAIAGTEIVVGSGVTAVGPVEGIHPEWLAWRIVGLRPDLDRLAIGTMIAGVRADAFDALTVRVPPIQDQIEIARAIRAGLAALRIDAQLKAGDAMAAAVVAAGLTGRLCPVTGRPGPTIRPARQPGLF